MCVLKRLGGGRLRMSEGCTKRVFLGLRDVEVEAKPLFVTCVTPIRGKGTLTLICEALLVQSPIHGRKP